MTKQQIIFILCFHGTQSTFYNYRATHKSRAMFDIGGVLTVIWPLKFSNKHIIGAIVIQHLICHQDVRLRTRN